MLHLPSFTLLHPKSVLDAIAMRRDNPTSFYIAGGTDLVPGMKQGLHTPTHVISLRDIVEFRSVTCEPNDVVRVGALTTLQSICKSSLVRMTHPGLQLAASLVAAPQHRAMGTLGGNVMLDTRCRYYNQDDLWRPDCFKKGSDFCHVVQRKGACVAARSGDTVAPLVALGAQVEYHDAQGIHSKPLLEIFGTNGQCGKHLLLPPEAFVCTLMIPAQPHGWCMTYRKERLRESVDFPELSIAVGGIFRQGGCESLTIVVSAIRPKPKVFRLPIDRALSDELIEEIAAQVEAGVNPIPNLWHMNDEPHRQHMVGVHVRRALHELRAQSP